MASTSSQTDPEVIRNSMTREVTNDASTIAGQIFRGPAPDVSHVSNDQLDQHYKQAFQSGDRQFLMAEAIRDPVQFMASMDRLGVSMPAGQTLPPNPPLPAGAKPNVDLPKPPAGAQQTYSSPEDVPQQVPQLAPAQVPQLPAPGGAAPALPPMSLPVAAAPTPMTAAAPPPMPPPPGV